MKPSKPIDLTDRWQVFAIEADPSVVARCRGNEAKHDTTRRTRNRDVTRKVQEQTTGQVRVSLKFIRRSFAGDEGGGAVWVGSLQRGVSHGWSAARGGVRLNRSRVERPAEATSSVWPSDASWTAVVRRSGVNVATSRPVRSRRRHWPEIK